MKGLPGEERLPRLIPERRVPPGKFPPFHRRLLCHLIPTPGLAVKPHRTARRPPLRPRNTKWTLAVTARRLPTGSTAVRRGHAVGNDHRKWADCKQALGDRFEKAGGNAGVGRLAQAMYHEEEGAGRNAVRAAC